MKEYTVEWHDRDGRSITHIVKADTESDAFDKAMELYGYSEYPDLYVWVDEEEYKQFRNAHFVETDYGTTMDQAAKPKADDSTQQPITSTDSPQSSGWATLYRAFGAVAFFIGGIGTIVVAQKNEEAGFQLAVMAIALTLTCFLFAFLIDVLTDMRHYLKRIAEKQ
tara:strand:+ start:154 stop:651 length:498 start_codon:yes stop_codon:yes gene_type:complete